MGIRISTLLRSFFILLGCGVPSLAGAMLCLLWIRSYRYDNEESGIFKRSFDYPDRVSIRDDSATMFAVMSDEGRLFFVKRIHEAPWVGYRAVSRRRWKCWQIATEGEHLILYDQGNRIADPWRQQYGFVYQTRWSFAGFERRMGGVWDMWRDTWPDSWPLGHTLPASAPFPHGTTTSVIIVPYWAMVALTAAPTELLAMRAIFRRLRRKRRARSLPAMWLRSAKQPESMPGMRRGGSEDDGDQGTQDANLMRQQRFASLRPLISFFGGAF